MLTVFVFARYSHAPRFFALLAGRTLITILFAALCPGLAGQMRGMRAAPARISAGAQFRGHPSAISRSSGIGFRFFGQRTVVVQRFPFRHHLRSNLFFANACFTNAFLDPFLCQRFFFRTPLFLNQVVLPYPIYYPIYSSQPYVDDQRAYLAEQRENELVQRIDGLTDEVERLREQQALADKSRESGVQHPEASENEPTKVLIFRDGHRSEIKNYAVIGKTLWVLTEQRAQKIPVSELDMEATKKVNADRGIEFP